MIDRLKCYFGLHKPDDDYILEWFTKRYRCKCERCGKDLYEK
ncbi:hypothetical protein NVP1076O_14 [Vibrio phage 1.076.O._10N.286.51.B7]|nr:hypothetical protein NVP1076O_14 [Vibrio phage 1.076.O._10N.286.51.B7]